MAVVTQFQFRRGTAAQWTSANPTLASGEFGYETDTGKGKIGDGTTTWTLLSYAIGSLPVGSITGLGTGVATWLATPSSANLASAVTDETGSGALVFATSPTLTTPNIGVASGTSFNSITGLSSTTPAANSGAGTVGTGTTTARADHVHPTTGLGLTASGLNQFAATTSSQLAGVISDETGSGSLVFATSPTLVTPILGTPTSGTLTNCTGLPVAGITSSTTTALGVGSIELGNATDTTISRVSAGVVAIEGVNVVTTSSTDTLTNKTLTTPTITQGTATPTFTTNAYTLVSGDAGKLLLASNSTTAGTVNVPTNASVAFATGTQITILQTGSGQLTISATTPATTTILSSGATPASPKCRVQYSAITLIKTATDTWYAVGDIS